MLQQGNPSALLLNLDRLVAHILEVDLVERLLFRPVSPTQISRHGYKTGIIHRWIIGAIMTQLTIKGPLPHFAAIVDDNMRDPHQVTATGKGIALDDLDVAFLIEGQVNIQLAGRR